MTRQELEKIQQATRLENNKTEQARALAILSKAIGEGYVIGNRREALEDVVIDAEDYLIDVCEHIEVEITVEDVGNAGQRWDWVDEAGRDYWEQGEIIDWQEHWHKAPDAKIIITTIVDSEANVIDLFTYVGENEYNAPDGFTYDHKTGKHIAIEGE